MIFAPGDAVRVRDDWPERRGPCHVRTPHYVRGARGVVARALGNFADPSALAFGRSARTLALYHVRFDLPTLWGEDLPGDAVLVELYETWLEAA